MLLNALHKMGVGGALGIDKLPLIRRPLDVVAADGEGRHMRHLALPMAPR